MSVSTGAIQNSVFPMPAGARLLMVALILGLVTLAAVGQGVEQRHDGQCGAFTVGVSAIGGCDGIGGKTSKAAIFKWRLQTLFQLVSRAT